MSVITVAAAFSASAGCEDNENPEQASTPDGSVDGGKGRDAGLTSCPVRPPAGGETCSFSGTCDYERCGSFPITQASCEQGKVVIRRTSCNPPFPRPDAGGPADAAVDGSTALRGMDGG
ncbi:MAG: hypothetical protein JWN48_3355 [Myxococcaceae bacterium]|nr:hypothetical protein [Myxococcaceae bacterium]